MSKNRIMNQALTPFAPLIAPGLITAETNCFIIYFMIMEQVILIHFQIKEQK